MTTRDSFIRITIFFLTIVFIVTGTLVMIRFAKGDRLGRGGSVVGTGLLSANSFPTGAEVYIDGKLTTATDATLNLDPKDYFVEIKKDGYHTWSKTFSIKAELVTQTNSLLIPTSPSLEPLTYAGAENPLPAPDGSAIIYTVASASSSAKNGLYLQDLASSPINLGRNSRQLARTSPSFDYSTASYLWSPSGSEVLVAFADGSHVLLDTGKFNDLAALKDVTIRLPQILRDWEEIIARSERTRLLKLPDFFQQVIEQPNTPLTNLYFSQDGTRLLYQALDTLTIPQGLIPELPGSSTQLQARELVKGSWYVYDLKEDRNYLILQGSVSHISKINLLSNIKDPLPVELESSPSAFKKLQTDYSLSDSLALMKAQYNPVQIAEEMGVQWYPDNNHLVISSASAIDLIEYDGQNRVTLYAGPFDNSFVFAEPVGERIITRIKFSPDTTPNLYTIKLK